MSTTRIQTDGIVTPKNMLYTNSQYFSNIDEGKYFYASAPTLRNNIRSHFVNHQTTQTETEHGQYEQDYFSTDSMLHNLL
jgi:hypothetical protein